MEVFIEKWSREQQNNDFFEKMVVLLLTSPNDKCARPKSSLNAMENPMYSIFIQLYKTIMVSAI